MTKTLARKRREYAPHEIDTALTTLAFYGGNAQRASAELGIPPATLKLWRNTSHADRYLEIQEREGPKLEAIAAGHAREIILRTAEAEHGILDRLSADDIDPETGESLALTSKELSELAGALQRVATAKGINTTKLLELTGRPTSIVEHRDPAETVNALARKLGIAIDGTATEIPSAPPTRPLLSASGEANAWSAPVQTTPDHAVD
jgi:hypothetical protein